MSDSVDLKQTVNLPRTDFPLKGNLAQNEPQRLAKWDAMNIYEKLNVTNRTEAVAWYFRSGQVAKRALQGRS